MTFRDVGAGLVWTMERATVIGRRRFHLSAEGRVVGIEGSTVMLEGRYTVHPTAYGAPIRYQLRRGTSNELRGTWIGSDQRIYDVTLQKAPLSGVR